MRKRLIGDNPVPYTEGSDNHTDGSEMRASTRGTDSSDDTLAEGEGSKDASGKKATPPEDEQDGDDHGIKKPQRDGRQAEDDKFHANKDRLDSDAQHGDNRDEQGDGEESSHGGTQKLEVDLLKQLMDLTVQLEAEARQMMLDSMEKGIARTLLLADRNGT
jgi:potassium channel subfamily K